MSKIRELLDGVAAFATPNMSAREVPQDYDGILTTVRGGHSTYYQRPWALCSIGLRMWVLTVITLMFLAVALALLILYGLFVWIPTFMVSITVFLGTIFLIAKKVK